MKKKNNRTVWKFDSLKDMMDRVASEHGEKIAFKYKEDKEIKEVTYNVTIHCKNCLKKLQENLPFEKGVKDLHICMEDQIVSFKYDASKTSEETLKNAIIKLGVPVKGKSQAGHQHNHK